MVPRLRIEVWSRVIALVVDASSWKDGGEGKRKRDKAIEVIRNIRLRRDNDDGNDGDAGGVPTADKSPLVLYSILSEAFFDAIQKNCQRSFAVVR
jgi:hypothetical protein